jgi:hypothetical protein
MVTGECRMRLTAVKARGAVAVGRVGYREMG